ncbi:MAG: phosphotransferase, partial [Polyangiaceae bacterium]|nr:phosphotransferase [Polyangiaceae bacterium]
MVPPSQPSHGEKSPTVRSHPAQPSLEMVESMMRANGWEMERHEWLPGGASTRRYVRIHAKAGSSAPKTLVGMYVPDGDRPEEIEKAGTKRTEWPFLEVHALLRARGIRVPKLYGDRSDVGWLLLEDLGDETLAEVLAREPQRKEALYRDSIRSIAKAHIQLADLPPTSIVRTRLFDYDLLRWELDHFREWGLDAMDHPLGADDLATLNALFDDLAKRISKHTLGFVHRDYQSRNIMVADELVWIDFQDAMMGPRTYDLVSLLGDSYQTFDEAFVSQRIREYAEIRDLPYDELRHEFDTITVQRKLKDAGRFIFIDRVKKNPSFLQYYAPSLKKVYAALERLIG